MGNKHRGRPLGSKVRQNMVEILYFYNMLYGYEIYKIYRELFPKITLRLVYYHLRKGLETKEFKLHGVKSKDGKFSWGAKSENIMYELGEKATPAVDERVKEYYRKKEKN